MYYVKDIPYMKALPRKVLLPKGEPIGKGNLVFLFSNSIEESIDMINEPTTFTNNNKYYWYFYNLNYIGKVGVKRYRFKDLKQRVDGSKSASHMDRGEVSSRKRKSQWKRRSK